MNNSIVFRAGFAGACLLSGITSLRQDMLGKDGYIRYVEVAWVSGWWSIPLAVVCVLAGCFGLWSASRDEKASAK